jgi:uncharacterized membrane protein
MRYFGYKILSLVFWIKVLVKFIFLYYTPALKKDRIMSQTINEKSFLLKVIEGTRINS